MDNYIARSTAMMTFAITFIVLVEKVASHEGTITELWNDLKTRGPRRAQRDEEKQVVELYRAISRWEHRT